ncbi:BZ3500_MvSof-1268-A1-R1_Chr2-1g04094 [Microbotryum saponariae]|uniref:BZ3500_MvSof-1268-A1-R1_Chr2-1g04094 protein n=1 Tax=Microbotryum saponariae TaxID=289078 RepID=A0A2X0KXL0_9BASI|nr:BZ3500_MvSof-1268-A1-R1_Chr2-1g04094 [Microbotryum saponariae]SCZ91081.1 BZ3501_MvSof-1269-A2-R1_Chr2-1g03750 [Microbotryum saponariae]
MSSRTSLVHFRGRTTHLSSTSTDLIFDPTPTPLSQHDSKVHTLKLPWDRVGTLLKTSEDTVKLSWIEGVEGQEKAVVEEVQWKGYATTPFEKEASEADLQPPQEEDWLAHLRIPSHLLSTPFENQNNSKQHTIHIVRNPTCSQHDSRAQIVLSSLLTLLVNSGHVHSERSIHVHETTMQAGGTMIGRQIVLRDPAGPRTVVVLGGDGTVGEVVNGLLQGVDVEGEETKEVKETGLVIIPLGTANALYHHHFPPEHHTELDPALRIYQSVFAYLHRRNDRPRPLNVALNILPSLKGEPERLFTLVVTSTALHANILYDAEKLRSTHPGVQRFKIAAGENATRWYEGKIKMVGAVSRWDAGLCRWVYESGEIGLDGPWVYVVGSLVSRFEKDFIVAPLRTRSITTQAEQDQEFDSSIDVVLVRPLRDPLTRKVLESEGAQKAKEFFVAGLWETLGGIYRGGKHVGMRWNDGTERVEYYRCRMVEWDAPDSDDVKDRLVCLDGLVRDLGSKGEGHGRGRYAMKALGSGKTGLGIWA